ncbi:MAG: hypothetical protein H7A23_25760 [Leptospiraceae bacterium]|nr:hypothetical protein [Leptospiraceae bacterium]MCP5497975.1 hypothetical protein [Leptospiraceae bacterium]
MVNEELTVLYNRLEQATSAEDMFGIPENVRLDDKEALSNILKEIYHRLAKILHPDMHTDVESKEFSSECFTKLQSFYNKALLKIEKGLYGQGYNDFSESEDTEFVITTAKRKYNIRNTLAQGDLSTVYGGTAVGGDGEVGKIAIKLVEDPADNDLIQNEISIIKYFASEGSIYNKHLPTVLDEFKTKEGQMGIVFRQVDGYDSYSVREKYKDGIPQRHIIWIFRRALSIIGYAHSRGVIHGNIEPAHIMVRPKDHNLYLIDWCYAIWKPKSTGQGFKCYNEDYSPPEVAEKKPPIPASDLYSLGKCMIFLLGGNIKTNSMPKEVDDRIQRFIKFFVKESAVQRPQDAWEMYHKLDDLRKDVFGPHQFVEFVL